MAIEKSESIWHNGKLIPWDEATIHVMSHVVHYGSSVFEGIRCYAPPSGPAIFRATEHIQRLLDSAKVYRIDVDYTREQLVKAMLETVGSNGAWPCYVRPIILRGYGEAGVNPFNSPDRGLHHQLSVGKISGRRERRLRRLRFFLDAAGAEHAAGHGQGRRELHELAAHQDGSHRQRLCRGHCARYQRLRQRRLGRERIPRASREADHGAAGQFRAARHHPRFGAADRARPGHSDRRADDSARDALHRRRGLLHRHGGRGHSHPIGRQDQSGQGRSWPDHQGDPEGVLRHRARRKDRPPRLAYAGAGAQPSSQSAYNPFVIELDPRGASRAPFGLFDHGNT